MSHQKSQPCIDICLECAVECDHCASECLKESDVKMLAMCIQLDRECAEMCLASARMMSLGSEHAADVCRLCAEFCHRCADECAKHAHMEHCQKCAEKCRECANECEKMVLSHVYLIAG